ncbi:MAG: trimeric intracellular cation channel family protein [Bacteroidota bacterium]
MLSAVTAILDWFGVIVFAITGALVASRKQMDLVGFALLGTVTGIGGGTIRDVVLGLLPVFWVREPAYLVTCVLVSCLVFFTAHIPQSRYRFLLWLDAVGLALFAVTGAERAMLSGAGSIAAIAMGVITATFGGMVRDVLGGESPVILAREIYVSAALLGASSFILLIGIGVPREGALISGFMVVLLVRGAALRWDWSLPRYRPRPGR